MLRQDSQLPVYLQPVHRGASVVKDNLTVLHGHLSHIRPQRHLLPSLKVIWRPEGSPVQGQAQGQHLLCPWECMRCQAERRCRSRDTFRLLAAMPLPEMSSHLHAWMSRLARMYSAGRPPRMRDALIGANQVHICCKGVGFDWVRTIMQHHLPETVQCPGLRPAPATSAPIPRDYGPVCQSHERPGRQSVY